MIPRLSILLATIVSRADLFSRLLVHLQNQAVGKPVEIISECDNKEISIGAKRQKLLTRATGDYVCFVDDDDWVAPNYVDAILRALEHSPDCVGFEIKCLINGRPRRAIASRRYNDWCDNRDGYDFCRSPYHKVPIKREIALKIGFPDLRYAEDKIYSSGVTRLCQSEVFIPEELYIYRYTYEPFAKKYGIKPTGKFDRKGRRIG